MRKLGIIIIILGLLGVGAGLFIKGQVDEGKIQISSAKEKVNQGHSILSLTPITKGIQNHLSAPVEEKIAAGEQQVKKYESLYKLLLICGIAVAVIGLIFCFICKKK